MKLFCGRAIVFAVGTAAMAASAIGARAEAISVVMNQAKIIKIARPADTVVIGNPDIADAVVQDARTIVLTGRGFGVTNIVALDVEGQPIVDERVIVSRQTVDSVRVYRRSEVQTLSCTPFCESAYKSDAERMSEAEMSNR